MRAGFVRFTAGRVDSLLRRSGYQLPWHQRFVFPKLKVLKLHFQGRPSALKLPGPFSAKVFPSLSMLILDFTTMLDSADILALARLFGQSHRIRGVMISFNGNPGYTEPEALTFLCGMRNLHYFLAHHGDLTGLPECFGKLVNLRMIDVRDHSFHVLGDKAMPASLSALTSMQEFVAFQKSDFSCPPRHPQRHECVYGSEELWRCPWRKWRVQFHDPDLPWWTWHNITKFWVDGCWFEGHIPDLMATAWPRLRLLDLYDNNLQGTIPESMATLGDLYVVQAQHNNLSGKLPSAMLQKPIAWLRIQQNKYLTGCIPDEVIPRGGYGHGQQAEANNLMISPRGEPGHLPVCSASEVKRTNDDKEEL